MTEMIPHPGGRLDAVAQAAAHEAPPQMPEAPPAEDRFLVPVRTEMPEECIPRTLPLSAANPYLAILPRDMRRRRAVLLAIDNDVVLCETRELAQQVAAAIASGGASAATLTTGGYLPKGTAVPLESRDAMWAAATTTASGSRVLVIAERYAEG